MLELVGPTTQSWILYQNTWSALYLGHSIPKWFGMELGESVAQEYVEILGAPRSGDTGHYCYSRVSK